MTTAHGICKKCGKEAVHLAMSGLITFCGDQDDDLGDESVYMDELITPDNVSVGIHICFECGAVEDVWIEDPHENETIKELRAENARLTAAHEAAADELARVVQELREAREALECTFNWAMTEESDPNGGFDIFAEEIVPMIGKVLGRE